MCVCVCLFVVKSFVMLLHVHALFLFFFFFFQTQGMPTPQLNMGLMIRHNPVVQYNHRPSRLPVPKRPYNDYHHGQNPGGHGGGNGGGGGGGMVSHSLPPINPRQQAQVQRRGYSNHERQKAAKLPSLVKPR